MKGFSLGKKIGRKKKKIKKNRGRGNKKRWGGRKKVGCGGGTKKGKSRGAFSDQWTDEDPDKKKKGQK